MTFYASSPVHLSDFLLPFSPSFDFHLFSLFLHLLIIFILIFSQAQIMRQLLLAKGGGRTDVLGLAMALRATR